MNKNRISRRDALKILGTAGLILGAPKLFHKAAALTGKAQNGSAPNFLVMVFDTFSAPHMSLFGYARKTTPNIDKFAARSTVFRRNYAPSNFTHASTASMLTGAYPWSHRGVDFFTSLLPKYHKNNIFSSLAESHVSTTYTHNVHTDNVLQHFREDIDNLKPISDLAAFNENALPELFEKDATLGFYAAKRWRENFFSKPSHSLFLHPYTLLRQAVLNNQADMEYSQEYPMGLARVDGYTYKLEDTIDWLIETVPSKTDPFLDYIHVLPPHEPYRPRAEFLDMFKNDGYLPLKKPDSLFSGETSQEALNKLRQLYDEYIVQVDDEFGRLVEQLEARGALENTYLILTSDHGQTLERGVHGHMDPTLYESVIHVPLIIHAPGQTEGREVNSPTSLIDLAPTIAHLAGRPIPEHTDGQVLPTLGGNEDPERVIFSMHARQSMKWKPLDKVTFAVMQGKYKLIKYRGYEGREDTVELYDLENDPEELNDLAGENPSIVGILQETLNRHQSEAEAKALGG